jgi:hypothetical protein
MAGPSKLIQCPQCASFVSADADHCPNCGARLTRGSSVWENIGRRVLAALLGLVALFFGAAGACILLIGAGGWYRPVAIIWLLAGAGLLVIARAAFKQARKLRSPRPPTSLTP